MTFEELVENQRFREWVKSGQATNSEYWQSELANTDATLIEEAAAFVHTLQFQPQTLPSTEIDLAWEQLEDRIATPQVNMSRRLWIRRVAAAITVLLVSTSAFFIFTKKSNKTIVKSTDFGEQLAWSLQDESSVQLNANSELSYLNEWEEGKSRKVKLNGQAFFDVQSLPSKANFEVETDYFTIEVLGTQFDVVSRDDKASVVLKEGSITVHFSKAQNVVVKGQVISTNKLTMKPNDYLRQEGEQYILSNVNAERKISWTTKKFYLDTATYDELLSIFRDTYGYKVINPKDFNFENLNGTLPLDNLKGAISALENLYNIKVKKVSENTLKFVK